MISAKRAKKRAAKRQGKNIAAAPLKPLTAAKPNALSKEELNSFLALHVGESTDAYLRALAIKQKKWKNLPH